MTIPCFVRFRPGSIQGTPSDGQTPGESQPAVVAVGHDATLEFHPLAAETLAPFGTEDWDRIAKWRVVIVPAWRVNEIVLFASESVTADSEAKTVSFNLRDTNPEEMGEALAGRNSRRVCVEIAGFAQGESEHAIVIYQFEVVFVGSMNTDVFTAPSASVASQIAALSDRIDGALTTDALAETLAGLSEEEMRNVNEVKARLKALIDALQRVSGGTESSNT